MSIHDAAARGFARGAEEYERGRPSYAAGAVERLVRELSIGPGTTVVDLGAGTGKFTRLLAPTGARVIGVERVAEMRDVFARVLPGVDVVEGTAESMPFGDGSVDVVTAAQTFHWVDAPAAVAEVARVLRHGGGFGLVWNSRDTSVPWVRQVKELMDRVAGDAPRYGSGWRRAVVDHGGFGPVERAEVGHDQPMTPATMRARVASTSYVSALPDGEREEVLREVDAIVAPLGESFAEPYVTEVFWCRRV
jgi:SAM-dependent methyltransferase